MKTLCKPVLLFLPLLLLFVVYLFQVTVMQQNAVTPTPTYDPFIEPALPANPTEYELGRNLYWHWCMTCHGDKGQGLTDEFRRIWPPDHQNCWGRGCHAGRQEDMGFPIPTVVPALVDENHLRRFSSKEVLADFLQATHPPQSPGILKEEEYQAIALFVFTMNGRLLAATPTFVPTPTPIPPLDAEVNRAAISISDIVVLMLFVLIVLFLLRRLRAQHQEQH